MVFVSLSVVYFKNQPVCASLYRLFYNQDAKLSLKILVFFHLTWFAGQRYSVSVEIIHNAADVQTANSVLSPLFSFFFFPDSAIKLWDAAPLRRLDNTKPIKTDGAFGDDVSLVFLDNCHFPGSVPDWVGFITGVSERHLGNN